MRLSPTRSTLFALVGVLVAGALFAQAGTRVSNWTVPPYRATGSQGGYTTMVDISDASVFVAVTPCRVIDTRFASGTGHGAPALAGGATRLFDMNAGPCTGIPENVAALSLSIGGILPPADGFLKAWPTGTTEPLVSQLNFLAGEVVANAAIVPVDALDRMNILVNVGPTDVYVDVNGYFMDSGGDLNDNTTLFLDGNDPNEATITGFNRDAASTSEFMAGIRGGITTTADNPSAVLGINTGDTGRNYGVRGRNDSGGTDSAGVLGVSNLDDDPLAGFPIALYSHAGVRGESGSNGVIGIGETAGVIGALADTVVALPIAQGRLGTNFGADPGSGAPPWAVFALGDTGASGTKHFVDPHPTEAGKVISYISLEGPEAGTYFRGRGKFDRGMAKITIPEDFRLVTDPEGLTVQVTPIGAMATVGVIKIDLNEIVVQSSRNVEFSYLVQGVRATHKNVNIIFHDGMFRPESADATMAPWLTEGQKQRLITNGTFREDGKVNMETARRLGWDRVWAERDRPTPQPAE